MLNILCLNNTVNIVVLVPTRALINQVSRKLRGEFQNSKYKVLTHPVIPEMYRRSEYHYIFVFTPERWISYISNFDNPVVTYMFIDEAQKVIAQKDSRTPLYYHAILLAERKSINLYFASPNIPNVEVFLELFEKSQNEKMVISDSPVAQNRYFFDFINQQAILFSDTGTDIDIPYEINTADNNKLNTFLMHIGENSQNIIYCNTIEDTISFARCFSKFLPIRNSKKKDDFISLIKTFIHKDYYLIECIKHGVAFHFGRLPQRIREQVEKLFIEGEINYVFCTSTLLEGVNLPAKNIFILNNAIGLSKFTDIDFWNLAGRAGRLSKELSGNIICIRESTKKNRWDTPQNDLKIVRTKKIQKKVPAVINGEKNFYINIGNAIKDISFTKKNPTEGQIEIWKHYSNILYIHKIEKNHSILINNFLTKNPDAQEILAEVEKENKVPLSILEQSSMINPKYQNELWKQENLLPFPSSISKDSCMQILDLLYESYNWKNEESNGQHPIIRKKSSLKYLAFLMYYWIQGTPLNIIINKLIDYYKESGKIYIHRDYSIFDANNKDHINHIINELMADIDSVLRFRIKNYLQNYSLICQYKIADTSCKNWVNYVEYGTTNRLVIELQNIGIPRHLANFIIREYPQCMHTEDNVVTLFDEQYLKDNIEKKAFQEEYNELGELLNWK